METLAHAEEAYADGRMSVAREIAQAVHVQAQRQGDHVMQGRALWQLAQVNMVCGQVETALGEGQQALLLFESLGDREGEARSLISVAYAAAQLRDNGLALASAQRALKLSEAMGNPVLQAAANNYLGVALFWDGDARSADERLCKAMELVARTAGRQAQVRPMVNRATGELVRLTFERVFNDAQPDPVRLLPLVEDLSACDLAGVMPFLSAGLQIDCEAVAAWPHFFAACWRGDMVLARECLDLCVSRAASGRLGLRWIVPYVAWARHELAYATEEWSEAATLADDIVNSAGRIQNQQLVWLGSALKLRALEAMGLSNDAARGWRALIRRDMGQRQQRRFSGAMGGTRADDGKLADVHAARHLKLVDWECRYGLTHAEGAVLDLLGQGLSTGRIALMRGTSVGTVRAQLKALFDKTGLRSQQALIAALGGVGAEAR